MLLLFDTNVLLVIIPSASRYHFVYEHLKQNKFELAVSNDILLEYEEQLKVRYKLFSVDKELENLLENKNVLFFAPSFKWNLIQSDPDDNKFVDCAIAANANFIITNDNHFSVLKSINFPKVNILTLQQFIELLSH